MSRRETGSEREPSCSPVSQAVKQELENPNLFVYAALADDHYSYTKAVDIRKTVRLILWRNTNENSFSYRRHNGNRKNHGVSAY